MNTVSIRAYRRLLGAYLKPQGKQVALLAALLLAGIGLQLMNPQIIRGFIDTAQAGGPIPALVLAGLAYLAIGLAGRGLALATFYTSQQVAWAATNALRADLTGHVLRLDMPFHKVHTPGELVERIDGDAAALGELFSQMTVRVAGNALLAIAILALLFREDTRAGVALSIYTAVMVAVLLALQNLGVRRWAAARQAWADQTGFLEEHIAGVEDIRGVGAEAYVLGKLQGLLRALLERSRGGWMANALGGAITNFLYVAGYGLGLAIGALLYTRGEATIGTAFLIVYYIGMLAAPLDEIRRQAGNLQQATASVGRVNELFDLQPQVTETPRAGLPPGALNVAFEAVSFAYNAPQSTLTDISFTLAPGRVLGVLGRTGSGKTTLTRLLFRLYDPQAGAIRVGGVDLRDIAFADLRRRIGLVTQDVQLFSASVRDNTSLFDPAVSDDAIHRSLAELDLLHWVEAMPGGLDARLAAGGGGMSAGEAQLLAFARLLLRDPDLVILDEAASRLDPVTEARLERAIDRIVGRKRTAIIIAHRLSTVQRADDILILEAGRVVEFGPREQLAADPASRFSGLLRTGLTEVLA